MKRTPTYTAMAAILSMGCGTGTKLCPPYGNDPECEFYNDTDPVEQESEEIPTDGPCAAIGTHLGKKLVPFGNIEHPAWLYGGAGQPVSMRFEGFPNYWSWTGGAATLGNVAELYAVADSETNTTELVMWQISTSAPYLWIQTRGVTAAQLGEQQATFLEQADGSSITYVSTSDSEVAEDWQWWMTGVYGSQVRVRGHVTDGGAVEAGPAWTNVDATYQGGAGWLPSNGSCIEPPMPPDPCAIIAERLDVNATARDPYPEGFIGNASGVFEDVYSMSWTPIVGWLWDGMAAAPQNAAAQLIAPGQTTAFYPGTFEPGDVLWVHAGAAGAWLINEEGGWLTDDVGFVQMDDYALGDGSKLYYGEIAGGVGNPAVQTAEAIRGRVSATGGVEAGPDAANYGVTTAFGAAFVPAWGVCEITHAAEVNPCAMISDALGENLEPSPTFTDGLEWGGPRNWAGDAVGVLGWDNEAWTWVDPGEPGDPALLDPGDGVLELGFGASEDNLLGWTYVITQGDGLVELRWMQDGAEQSVQAESIEFDEGLGRVWLAPAVTDGLDRAWVIDGLPVRGIVTTGGSMPTWVEGLFDSTDATLGGVERGFVAGYGYCVPAAADTDTDTSTGPSDEPLDDSGTD